MPKVAVVFAVCKTIFKLHEIVKIKLKKLEMKMLKINMFSIKFGIHK